MYYVVIKRDTDYLMHHRIKGQKWGIRRFQNPDGTLTREGKAKYKTDIKFKNKWDKFAEREKTINKLTESGVSKRVAKLASKYITKKAWTRMKLLRQHQKTST